MNKTKHKFRKKELSFNMKVSLLIATALFFIFITYFINIGLQIRSSLYNEFVKTETLQNIPQNENSFDYSKVRDYDLHSLLSPKSFQKVYKLGRIAVPAYHVNLPIVYGIDNASLLVGAGTLHPDERMGVGNYALAGHNVHDNKTLFAPLEHAKKGAKVYVSDNKTLYTYRLDHVQIIAPTDVHVVTDQFTKPVVTLLLCTADGKKRIYLRGTLINKTTNNVKSKFSSVTKTHVHKPFFLILLIISGLIIIEIRILKKGSG